MIELFVVWVISGFVGACLAYGTLYKLFGGVTNGDARFVTAFGVLGGPLWAISALIVHGVRGDAIRFKVPFTGLGNTHD